MRFTYINSFNPHNNPVNYVLLLSPFKKGSLVKEIGNMLKITWKFRRGANVQTQAVSLLRVHGLNQYAKLPQKENNDICKLWF